jgi:hypothetical protein
VEFLEDRSVPSTFQVTNLDDTMAGSGTQGTLRYCIDQANAKQDADVIQFASGLKGVIVLSSELPITRDLTINGSGRVTISGNNMTRVFHISGGNTDVVMDDMTIVDGLVTDVTFHRNYGPVTLGGGILNDGAALTLSNMTFRGNRADGLDIPHNNSDGGGGAIASVFGGRLIVRDSRFIDNSASGLDFSGGGAIVSDGVNSQGSTASIEHCTFINNRATRATLLSAGGAVWTGTASAMTVSFSTFEGNVAIGNDSGNGAGGAAISEPYGFFHDPSDPADTVLTLTECVFRGNQAIGGSGVGGQGNGGALVVEGGGRIIVSHSDFIGNHGRGGDGSVANGQAGDSFGGAVCNLSSSVIVSHSTFRNNEVQGGTGGDDVRGGAGLGGAIGAALGDDTTRPNTVIESCEFIGNRALGGRGDNPPDDPVADYFGGTGRGGAIDNLVGDMTISNSRFMHNLARGGDGNVGNGGDARGGAVANEFGGHLTLTNVEITENRAVGGAGGIGGDGGDAQGAGIFNGNASQLYGPAMLTLSYCSITGNVATGGDGGLGGNGGDAQGGGIFNGNGFEQFATDPPIVQMDHSTITDNSVDGGAAGSGGNSGEGIGGGVYNQGSFYADAFSWIFDNFASTSDDDIFGDLLPL